MAADGSTDFSSLDRAALPFITVGEDDRFTVHEDAIAYLKSLTGKIAVVSIAGIYRTGKSYLLNQVMGKDGGFTVGPTVKACTKGIWLWGKAMHVEGGDMHVLFLDTEGLGSTIRSETYDCRIFALALLLSSYFMYNSFGTIDGNAVSKLSLVVNLTKHIHVRSQAGAREDSGTEFNQFFPHFLWVVRDFTVKLEKEGKKISAREYLEEALRPEEGMSEATEQKNAVRLLIRNFFPERDCVTMVRPVSDEKQLMNLTSLGSDALRPEFRAQIDALRKRIMSTVRPKTMYGKPLNGAMLASLAVAYCNALNVGGTPTISTAWDRVVDSQCQDAVEGAVKTYVTRMQAGLARAYTRRRGSQTLSPTSVGGSPSAGGLLAPTTRELKSYAEESTIVEEDELHELHSSVHLEATRYFQQNAVQDMDKTPPFEAQLREQLEQHYARFRKANDAASESFCLELLDRLHAQAGNRMAHVRAKPVAGGAGGAGSTAGAALAGPAGGVDEDATTGMTHEIAAAAQRTTPAAAVAKEYRAACDSVNESYLADARGPARHRVLSDYLINKMPSLILDAAMTSDDTRTAHISLLTARITDLSQRVAAAKGREKAATETLAQDKKSFETSLAAAARSAAEMEERLKSLLSARESEISRLQERFDKVLANAETASVRYEENVARSAQELAAANKRIDELQATRITALMDMNMLSQRLAEAETARADAVRLVGELQAKLVEESKAAAVMLERCRAAENETVRLREQTELLYESVRVQKDLLAAKNDEKEECEYQWGVAKAKLAQLESERADVDAELSTLSSIASRLKAHILKQGKTGMKGVEFNRSEQRVFDALEIDASML